MAAESDLNVEQFASALQGGDGRYGRILGAGSRHQDHWHGNFQLRVDDIFTGRHHPSQKIYARCHVASGLRPIGKCKRAGDGSAIEYGWQRRAAGSGHAGFVRNMRAFTDLPVLYWDERLSSFAAEQSMLEADMTRKKRARNIDQVAAALFCRAAWSGYGNFGTQQIADRRPPLLPHPKGNDGQYNQTVKGHGLGQQTREFLGIHAEHFAIETKHEVMQFSGKNSRAHVPVIGRQTVPNTQQDNRYKPQINKTRINKP